jgi:hypothetical protein
MYAGHHQMPHATAPPVATQLKPRHSAIRCSVPEQTPPLKPVGGSGRSFLGVRRFDPRDEGVHLLDDNGAEIAVVPYGEQVYVNGRVMSFTRPTP